MAGIEVFFAECRSLGEDDRVRHPTGYMCAAAARIIDADSFVVAETSDPTMEKAIRDYESKAESGNQRAPPLLELGGTHASETPASPLRASALVGPQSKMRSVVNMQKGGLGPVPDVFSRGW
jgi:hypothetical protein